MTRPASLEIGKEPFMIMPVPSPLRRSPVSTPCCELQTANMTFSLADLGAGAGDVQISGKRKRRRVVDPHISKRWQEAQQRHEAYQPHLSAAHLALNERLARESKYGSHQTKGKATEIGLGMHGSSSESLPAAAQGVAVQQPEPADPTSRTRGEHTLEQWSLPALSELRAVLHPKFRYQDAESSSNLFNEVIENNSSHDRRAWAHETEVLIPARSRFLLADMSNFYLLMHGESLCPSTYQ